MLASRSIRSTESFQMQTGRESEKTNQTRSQIHDPKIHRHRGNQRSDQHHLQYSPEPNAGDPGRLQRANSDAKHRSKAARTRVIDHRSVQMLHTAHRQGERLAIGKQPDIKRSRGRPTLRRHIPQSRNATPREPGVTNYRCSSVYWTQIRIRWAMRGMETLETPKTKDRLRLVLGGKQ